MVDAEAVSFRLGEKMAHKGVDPAALGDVLVRKQGTFRRLWEPRLRGLRCGICRALTRSSARPTGGCGRAGWCRSRGECSGGLGLGEEQANWEGMVKLDTGLVRPARDWRGLLLRLLGRLAEFPAAAGVLAPWLRRVSLPSAELAV